MKIKELIEKLEQKSSHQFLKAVSKPEFTFSLPKDLEFFYENYEYAILNIDTSCEIRISSLSELQPTNQILYPADDVIWEELEDDISNDWFMIASSQELSQYISIDLNKKRFGFCYDSFIETHATPDESPIIAKSFTELLEKLVSNEKEWFWLDSSFQSYGDAYEDEWVSCSPYETLDHNGEYVWSVRK